jgi:hypothetical protein
MTNTIQLRQSVEFAAKTAAGVTIQTFGQDCADRALSFVRSQANREKYPGLYLESIQTTVTTRRLWTDRASERRAA